VLLLDTFYRGTLKQKINCIVSPLFLKRYFNKVWVPGYFQFEYARRIGFKKEEIFTGVYAANLKIFKEKDKQISEKFNKCFYYVGRLIDVKGVRILLNVLNGFTAQLEGKNWTFCIIGNGKYENDFLELSQKSKSIKYMPFMQPERLRDEISNGGVFVLPSILESWGLVVQEFAALGFPLLLSDNVGANPHFLIDKYNGLLFEKNSENALKHALCKIMDTDEEELKIMGKRSSEVSNNFTPELWAAKLNTLILQAQQD
jgi:glycosyltransferase involved in cell wall biosynthesis